MQLTTFANAYVERLIGSIRRECLNHFIVLNARHPSLGTWTATGSTVGPSDPGLDEHREPERFAHL